MLKTNSAAVKAKIRSFILAEAAPDAENYQKPVTEYLRTIYSRAQERTKGTKETPAADIVNSCTCFFHGDYDIFLHLSNLYVQSIIDICWRA